MDGVGGDMRVRAAFFTMGLYGDQDVRGAEACEIVLRAVADGTLQKQGCPILLVGKDWHPSVLQLALEKCSASFVQRLLHIGVPYVDVRFDDSYRSSPMHVAVLSEVDAFTKCKMLDVRDLGRRDEYGHTPLDTYVCYLLTGYPYSVLKHLQRNPSPGALCRWMMEQAECPLDTLLVDIATTRTWNCKKEFQQMRQDALAVRKNWTPARAAWLGAAVLK